MNSGPYDGEINILKANTADDGSISAALDTVNVVGSYVVHCCITTSLILLVYSTT